MPPQTASESFVGPMGEDAAHRNPAMNNLSLGAQKVIRDAWAARPEATRLLATLVRGLLAEDRRVTFTAAALAERLIEAHRCGDPGEARRMAEAVFTASAVAALGGPDDPLAVDSLVWFIGSVPYEMEERGQLSAVFCPTCKPWGPMGVAGSEHVH